jgi:hypothetical protein
MSLEFRANRKRTETVTAVVTAAVQRELSDSAESDREAISLTDICRSGLIEAPCRSVMSPTGAIFSSTAAVL